MNSNLNTSPVHLPSETVNPNPTLSPNPDGWPSSKSHLGAAVDSGVWWWSDFLKKYSSLSVENIKKFEICLRELIIVKITDHWYPERPSKGQAFRSLSIDRKAHVDPILVKAAHSAGIENFLSFFSKLESVLMWIDPDVVLVRVIYAGYISIPPEDKVLYRNSYSPTKTSPTKSYHHRDTKTSPMGMGQQAQGRMIRGVNSSNGLIPPVSSSQYMPVHYSQGVPSNQYTVPKNPYLSQPPQRSSLLYNTTPFNQSQYIPWGHNGQFSDTWKPESSGSNSSSQSSSPSSGNNTPPGTHGSPLQQNGSHKSKMYIEYGLTLEAQA